MKKTCIYVATHKKFDVPNKDEYIPIEVGADLRDCHYGYTMDNTGDNISIKNKNYCELTALYWIWKNSDADIAGLVHYRRYFSRYRYDTNSKYFLSSRDVEAILEKKDIILPEEFVWRHHNLAEGYDSGAGYLKDLRVVEKIILDRHPQYIDTYRNILSSSHASYCNMMITKKKDFDDYCAWLFDILFEAEKMIDIEYYTSAEKRIFGYMSELLLNVWVNHNRKSIYYAPMVNTEINGNLAKYIYPKLEKIPLLEYIIPTKKCVDKKRWELV